ncbi:MAG TPA: hypothetical protein VFX98_17600 [Longimicrobiaceae bacterium]|nr:hypothetical protein [Longimicrobiaceae bacterium]
MSIHEFRGRLLSDPRFRPYRDLARRTDLWAVVARSDWVTWPPSVQQGPRPDWGVWKASTRAA